MYKIGVNKNMGKNPVVFFLVFNFIWNKQTFLCKIRIGKPLVRNQNGQYDNYKDKTEHAFNYLIKIDNID